MLISTVTIDPHMGDLFFTVLWGLSNLSVRAIFAARASMRLEYKSIKSLLSVIVQICSFPKAVSYIDNTLIIKAT